jgi:hypothetical protein
MLKAADLNKPNQYMVKRRTYKDIDISKDFEKRLNLKAMERAKEKVEFEKTNFDQLSLQELEIYKEQEMMKGEQEKLDDVSSKILVQDVR